MVKKLALAAFVLSSLVAASAWGDPTGPGPAPYHTSASARPVGGAVDGTVYSMGFNVAPGQVETFHISGRDIDECDGVDGCPDSVYYEWHVSGTDVPLLPLSYNQTFTFKIPTNYDPDYPGYQVHVIIHDCWTDDSPTPTCADDGRQHTYPGEAYFFTFYIGVDPNLSVVPNPNTPDWDGSDPIDSGGPDGCCGPSHGDPVNLYTGAEDYEPATDLTVYNPYGVPVSYKRSWHSALLPDGSPGLPPGWTDNYDYTLNPADSTGLTWGPLVFRYPNGATETLTPQTANLANFFGTDVGVPYRVKGSASTTTGVWTSVTLYYGDGTRWTFTPEDDTLAGTAYHLTTVTPLSGKPLQIVRNGDGSVWKVQAVTGSGNVDLLQVAYGFNTDDTFHTTLTDMTYPGGRAVFLDGDANDDLYKVSQVSPTTGSYSSRNRWTYAYTTSGGLPYLHTITVPSPTGSGTQTATINYSSGKVGSRVDANGNQRVYTYNPTSTKVEVKDATASHTVTQWWTENFDGSGRDTGFTDSSSNSVTLAYGDAANPHRPTSVTDQMGRPITYAYDAYGNVTQVTYRTGTSTGTTSTSVSYNYASYAPFPTGAPTQVTEGTKPATTLAYYTTTDPTNGREGQLKSVTAPGPSGSGVTSVTTTYKYTGSGLGQLAQVIGPGNNAASTVTATSSYTSDGTYSQAEKWRQPVRVTVGSATPSVYASYRYNAGGQLASATDQSGNETDYTYTLSGRPKRATFPATGQTGSGHSYVETTYKYDASPNDFGPPSVVKLYDEAGVAKRTTNYGYGKEGEFLSVGGSANEPASYAYDPSYRVKGVTDGNGHQTSYTYDLRGYLTQVAYPLATVSPRKDLVSVTPNADGSPSVVTDGRGYTKTYTYYPSGTLQMVAYSPDTTPNASYTYDSYNRLTNVNDGTGSRAYAYGNLDEVTSATTTYTGLTAKTLSYAYHPDGSRKTLTAPVSATPFTYSYDAIGRLSSLSNPFGETTSWGYKANGWLDHRTDHNSLTATYTYNAMGRLTALVNKQGVNTISTFAGNSSGTGSMGYDVAGNRLSMTVYNPWYSTLTSGTVTNAYDTQDRLTSDASTFLGARSHTFAYDTAGNPTTFKGAVIGAAYNNDNQRTSTGYAHDGDGNPTTYKTKALQYDPEDRLKYYGTSTTPALTMGYRSDGLRAWKQTSTGVRTYFLYDGATLLHEMNASGTVTATDTWGADGLVSRYGASGQSFYAYNPSGNVADVTGLGSTTPTAQEYDAYGVAVAGGGTSPHGYGAQWGYYTDTQTGLVLCTWRYYDPANGRFLNRDPIGFAGGINLYAYTGNNPINFVDPMGLRPKWVDDSIKYLFDGVINFLKSGEAVTNNINSTTLQIGQHLQQYDPINLGSSPNNEPEYLYRKGNPDNPAHATPRPGEDGLSVWDGLKNPLNRPEPGPDGKPRDPFRPGDPFYQIDPKKLPPGSVTRDPEPPGHYTIHASPEDIKNAQTGVSGKCRENNNGWW